MDSTKKLSNVVFANDDVCRNKHVLGDLNQSDNFDRQTKLINECKKCSAKKPLFCQIFIIGFRFVFEIWKQVFRANHRWFLLSNVVGNNEVVSGAI